MLLRFSFMEKSDLIWTCFVESSGGKRSRKVRDVCLDKDMASNVACVKNIGC